MAVKVSVSQNRMATALPGAHRHSVTSHVATHTSAGGPGPAPAEPRVNSLADAGTGGTWNNEVDSRHGGRHTAQRNLGWGGGEACPAPVAVGGVGDFNQPGRGVLGRCACHVRAPGTLQHHAGRDGANPEEDGARANPLGPSSKGRAKLGAARGRSLDVLPTAGAEGRAELGIARGRSLDVLAAALNPGPEYVPPLRGNYVQAVGKRHEYAGSRQVARGCVQSPVFVLLTAITLCMVCAIEMLTTPGSLDVSAFSDAIAAQPQQALHVGCDDSWSQSRGCPLSFVCHRLAGFGWPGLECGGLRLTLPPGALCGDETKHLINPLIKLVLGASVVAVTLAIIYESHHEFSCVGEGSTRHRPIAAVYGSRRYGRGRARRTRTLQ